MLFLQYMILHVLCWGHCVSTHFITKLQGQKQNKEFKQSFEPTIEQHQSPSVNNPAFRPSLGERWINRILDLLPKSLSKHKNLQNNNGDHFGRRETSGVVVRRRRKALYPLQSGERLDIIDEEKSRPAGLLKASPASSLGTVSLKNVPKNVFDSKSPSVFLPIQKIFADVGVGFQKYLSPDIFHDKKEGNARSLNIELLTADGNQLFDTSWIKFDQSNLKLYGFPLKGNQDEHLFLLKATNSKGKIAVQHINVVVFALSPVFNHYVHVCTKMTLSEYGGNVERRLRLAKSIGSYVFPGIRTDDVWIWKFQKGCIFLTFRHLPRQGECDFQAMRTIQRRLQTKREVNKAFQQALKGVTHIVSVNITVLNECKRTNQTNTDDGLGWLRDVAPVFILIAVVAVPTLISCIVCREVRRRQAMMRQLQDKRMKEDREQMLIQAAEYKHECGFDSESEYGDRHSFRPCRQQEDDGKKFFGFSRIADIIIPEVVIDTVKQGTEILNTFLPQEAYENAATDAIVAAQRRLSAVQSLHPMHKLLDISQEEQAQQQISVKNENEIHRRVKSILKFLKNPLDITSVVNEFEGQDDSFRENDRERRRQSKTARTPVGTFIPNISSLFGLSENEGRQSSLKEVTDNVSASIRSRLEGIWNKDSMPASQTVLTNAAIHEAWKPCPRWFSDKGNSHGWISENNSLHSGNELKRNIAQRTRASSAISFDKGSVPGIVPCIGARLRMDDTALAEKAGNRISLDGKIEGDSKGTGLINRVLKSKAMLEVKKKLLESRERSEEEIEMQERGLVWQNVKSFCPQKERTATDLQNTSNMYQRDLKTIHSKLGTPAEGRKREGQTRDCNYDVYSNLKRRHYKALQENDGESKQRNLHQEPNFSATAVKNQAILKSVDRYYINNGEKQVNEYQSVIRRADGSLNELDCRSWRQNISEKQALGRVLPKSCDFSSGKNNNGSKVEEQLVTTVKKGLRHYDPVSGKWYPAYSSIKKIIPDSKMFSLLESFKRTEHDRISRKKTLPTDSSMKGKLQWYNLETSAEVSKEGKKKEPERNRRKTGLDISAGFTESKSNPTSIFDQFVGIQCEGQISRNQQNIDKFVHGKMNRGIWTERQSHDDDGDDFYQSSDDEIEQQGFLDGFSSGQNIVYFPHEHFDYDSYGLPVTNLLETSLEHKYFTQRDSFAPEFGSRGAVMESGNVNGMNWQQQDQFTNEGSFELDDGRMYERERVDAENKQIDTGKDVNHNAPDESSYQTRRRSLTDSQLQLQQASCVRSPNSPTKSEPDCSERNKCKEGIQKERRRSFLERQRRVEIPEKLSQQNKEKESAKVHVNPMFIIEERSSKDETDERVDTGDRFDTEKGKRLQTCRGSTAHGDVRTRKLTYNGPFPTPYVEAEKIRKQDEDIIRHQTKGYLERRRQSLQHITGSIQTCRTVTDTEPIAIQNRAKRDDAPKRTGMRRFSTPSMDSWTSTPEKYYYDATGDNSISEEDVDCAGLRKDKEKPSFASGRGRAREYTQRLLQGVSPKIRRHSTTVMGQKNSLTQSGNATSGTFLEKFGERKFVQTIQTKLGKKESKPDEPKSPVFKEKEKFLEEEKTSKGSPLTAIRNTLFLFSGGK